MTKELAVKLRPPVDPAEGPWLIHSHYWNTWHQRSSTGGAAGYSDDISQAGVFDLQKAREYHDLEVDGRDEAIPAHRVIADLEARLATMDAERAKFAATVEGVRAALSAKPQGGEAQ